MSGHRIRRGLGVLALAAVLSAAAQAPSLRFASPPPGQAVFGPVEVKIEAAAGEAIERIELFLDGRKVGAADRPPYRIVVDAGQGNVEHRFEAVAYGAGGAAIASAQLRSPKIPTDLEIDVRLRQLYVTVAGHAGRLDREDFSVREERQPQRIVTFERGDIPFTAVLLVDASASMSGERLQSALQGARGFFGAMQPLDEAKLVLFADRLLLETPFTSVPSVLDLALGGARAAGGTALNDALYVAIKRLEPRQGRRVLILLSDGGDVESVLGMADVQKILARDPMALYWLRLRREVERHGPVDRISIWRDAPGHRREIEGLEKAVAESGGRTEIIDSIAEVPRALAGVIEELRGQYVLGYYSTAESPDAWRDVKVGVRGGGKVRIQKGAR